MMMMMVLMIKITMNIGWRMCCHCLCHLLQNICYYFLFPDAVAIGGGALQCHRVTWLSKEKGKTTKLSVTPKSGEALKYHTGLECFPKVLQNNRLLYPYSVYVWHHCRASRKKHTKQNEIFITKANCKKLHVEQNKKGVKEQKKICSGRSKWLLFMHTIILLLPVPRRNRWDTLALVSLRFLFFILPYFHHILLPRLFFVLSTVQTKESNKKNCYMVEAIKSCILRKEETTTTRKKRSHYNYLYCFISISSTYINKAEDSSKKCKKKKEKESAHPYIMDGILCATFATILPGRETGWGGCGMAGAAIIMIMYLLKKNIYTGGINYHQTNLLCNAQTFLVK